MATTSAAAPHDETKLASKLSIPFRREVEAMNYVRTHTSIPVPSILNMHFDESDEPGWILMERAPGRQVDEAWPIMTETAKARTISELHTSPNCIAFARLDLAGLVPVLEGPRIIIGWITCSVTGIVDWEMAGFWPEWWEYRKALFGSRSRQWWIDIPKQIMKEYRSETEADMELEMF
ncbi:phosphotransferase enzyme family domain-containing protein [Fusarium austroafricanum]|uniref:Phosphotransferase enzyme family domain-containing protein n=1 Tax=Fusarium austroafricanum TaxID=2364996 RepID=A0A8H4NZB6_9HYPO|nr:phosphotransferase enzyme family domain-containing protein [Fusarium austroafricanum]